MLLYYFYFSVCLLAEIIFLTSKMYKLFESAFISHMKGKGHGKLYINSILIFAGLFDVFCWPVTIPALLYVEKKFKQLN